MPNWTDEQKQAIYEKGENILVAAAAGSGKTAVLVERIINKVINEGIDIDKILVVTFTNAAAAEMRERILDALYKKIEEEPENERLQRQITLLNLASICTIDSFCLDIVKNYFYELENVSPNFRIADTAEIELLKQEVLEDLFEEKYINDDSNFAKLITTYTNYRDDTPLKDLILKIHTFISSSPFPEKGVRRSEDRLCLLARDGSRGPCLPVFRPVKRREPPRRKKKVRFVKPEPSSYQKLEKTPVYKGGMELFEYQLEGLNWLMFCWYSFSFKNCPV